MTGWTRQRVLQAAAAWVWVPDGADQVRTEDYQLIRYPDRLADPGWPPAQVAWSRTSRAPGEVIDEVARQVRRGSLGRAVTLIAVTGWGQDSDKAQALAAGFNHHFTKPIEPERLSELLRAGAPTKPAP